MKELTKRLPLTLLLCLLCTICFAQNAIHGKVLDSSGEPIIGASVINGTNGGTVTDINGDFTVNANSGDELKISYVGFNSQTIKVGNQNNLKITLKEDNHALNEVVVIGYGSVKKRDLTAAVSKMDGKSIADRPLARAEQALQGQLAGVQVRTVSGEPGADLQIRVRGAASVNASSDPLYVVDGVPMTTINGLNPSDIQSIEVLKDAASAAIYGSRGSNGVVIVTTKRGKNGKPTVSFNGSVGFQRPEKKLDLMSSRDWMEFRTKWNDTNYLSRCKTLGITGASIKDNTATRLANVGVAANSKDAYMYANDDRWFQYLGKDIQDSHSFASDAGPLDLLDWQDKCFRSAIVEDYDVNVSGGTDNVNYLVSGGYMKQDGIVIGTDFQRFTFRANIDTKINKYISIGATLAPTYISTNGTGAANGKDSQMHHILDSCPVSEPGVGYMTNVQPNERYGWAGTSASPWYILNTNINKHKNARLIGNAYLRVAPMDGLKLEFSGAVNYYDTEANTYVFTSTSPNWASGEGSQSSGGHSTGRYWDTLLQALANYDHTFGKHGISLMAGTSREQSNSGFETNQTFNKPFPNDAITGSFDGTQEAVGKDLVTELTPKNLVSVFGRAQYDYNDRYILLASIRWDGCSVFGGDNKWGCFPAFSGAWIVSDEKFWKDLNLNWLSSFKLRASYGVTGNNHISNTAAYATLIGSLYGGAAAYNANSLGNSDLGWEKTHSTDLAADFSFLNNAIQLSVDYYTKTTKDLLYQIPVAGVSGFTTTWANVGEIKNNGVDIELTTHNLRGAFKWDTSFNMSFNHNKVGSLGVDNTPIHSGFNGAGDGATASNILAVGHPVNAFYMYKAIGVWKSQAEIDAYAKQCGVSKLTFQGTQVIKPGDIKYLDVNHDGNYTLADDRVYLGQPTPKITYGLTNSFQWKGFDAQMLITAQTGGKILGTLGRAIDRPSMGAVSNMFKWWKNAWWSESDPGDGKTPYIMSTTTGGTVDSRWLYSSDYLSIKSLTLGYTVPMKSKWISNLRIYASFENLLRFDHYKEGYSPEASNASKSSAPGGATATGLDYAGYPTARIYTFGINLTF
ncbi:MAG: TonB-dependent receptor [Prevotella sp.]|jgi:TonB-linked SusC/RagA family outer membrane protein|nr:TonB-dependent receptor [Prevotella sp.]